MWHVRRHGHQAERAPDPPVGAPSAHARPGDRRRRAGFATGGPLVPHSRHRAVIFDLVLYNVAPLVASAACLGAARRVPEERLVWWGAAWPPC